MYEHALQAIEACGGRVEYYARRDPSFEPDDGWMNDWWIGGPGLREYKGDTPPEIAPTSDDEDDSVSVFIGEYDAV